MVQVHELGILYCMEAIGLKRSGMEEVAPYLDLPETLTDQLKDWPMELVHERLTQSYHGDFKRWSEAVASLPTIIDANNLSSVTETLKELHPWRKGPFHIGALHLNTEWRSDWKWERLKPHVSFDSHSVLDIGSGNGYFGHQILAAGAAQVIGIDPSILFCMQHQAIQHFLKTPNHWVLPLRGEEIPPFPKFDSVLSMGVIYHRRDYVEHVRQIAALTKPGGRAILESLITPASNGFKPDGRYARMRNVWWIPSTEELLTWMSASGFTEVSVVDITKTTTDEQRSTDWMTFESLAQSLDSKNPDLTVEGYPAPTRAIVIGTKE